MVTIPKLPHTPGIPKLLHQVCLTTALPQTLKDNTRDLAARNGDYKYTLYDDASAAAFLRETYGEAFLNLFERISPDYGAVRADLFRYALLYKLGGVFLDLKSNTSRPLRQTIRPGDEYILSHWDNTPGRPFDGWGLHDEVDHIPGGEFQQWHIMASAGHPFLAAVLRATVHNLQHYRPWKQGTGQPGVLRTSGPLVYTKAIEPLLDQYPNRIVRDEQGLGLIYSVFNSAAATTSHTSLFPRNYHQSADFIMPARNAVQAWLWNRRMSLERSHELYWVREYRNRAIRRLGFNIPDHQTRRFS